MAPFHTALLVLVLICSTRAEFNYSRCPHPLEIQSDAVKRGFNLTKFVGDYYELALHDYTQYPICPSPRCMSSHKTFDRRLNQVNDTFYIRCEGHTYPNTFHFKLTDIPGHFNGTWTFIPGVLFPNTVVEVSENADGVYEWVIEFQCVEKFDRVWFVGINWYSRVNNTDSQYLNKMLDAARDRGLGYYMNQGEEVYYVDQKNC